MEPEPYEQDMRASRFDQVGGMIQSFADGLASLLEPINAEDGLIAEDLEFHVSMWRQVFQSEAVKATFVLAPPEQKDALWITNPLLDDLDLRLRIITDYLRRLSDVSSANGHIDHLGDELSAALRRAKHNHFSYLPPIHRAELDEILKGLMHQLDTWRARGFERLQEYARSAAESAMDSATKASTAAGIASDAKMSSFYQALANREVNDARKFRWLTVYVALVAGAAALTFVLGHGSEVPWLDMKSDDYVPLIQKAILVGGIFGLAGYFARQAHQHRSMANWAESLAVQLQTFDAYLAAIESSEVKDDLRRSFGARVFGDHPAMKGEPTVTPSAAAMDTAVGWVAKLTAGGK